MKQRGRLHALEVATESLLMQHTVLSGAENHLPLAEEQSKHLDDVERDEEEAQRGRSG